MSPQPASTGPGAMYPAIATDQIREARRELVGAPLAQVATEAACALVDACAALAERTQAAKTNGARRAAWTALGRCKPQDVRDALAAQHITHI